MEKKKSRIDIIDIMKGIVSILVVIGHITPTKTIVHRFIYSFHMPVFFMLSGLVMKKMTITEFFKSKLMKIFIIYSLLYLFIDYVVRYHILKILTLKDIFCEIYMSLTLFGINVLWFISCLLIAKTIASVAIRNRKKISNIILYSIIFILIGLYSSKVTLISIPYIYYPLICLLRALSMVIFILIGYYSKKIIIAFKFKSNVVIIYIITTILLLLCALKIGFIDVRVLKFGNTFLFYITSIIGFISTLCLGSILENRKKIKKIEVDNMKKLSYYIMLFIFILFCFIPTGVFADSLSLEQVNNQLIDQNQDSAFSYHFTIEDTIKIVYKKESIEKSIISYLKNKISNDEIAIDIKNLTQNSGVYILSNSKEQLEGNFSYVLSNEINIEYTDSDDQVQILKEFVANILNCDSSLIEVNQIKDNQYSIKYNSVSYNFTVNYNYIKKEELNSQANVTTFNNSNNIDTVPTVNYQTHVQYVGWQDWRKNGEMSGTEGWSYRLEGIKIYLSDSNHSGDIEYQTHVQYVGWQDWRKNGEMSGTKGWGYRLEAIKIKLSGDLANQYDIYYRVHIQDYGWLGWTKNGLAAGSEGLGYRLEAIEIRIVKKGEILTSTVDPFIEMMPNIYSNSHIENVGWTGAAADRNLIGITGNNLRLEAIQLSLNTYQTTGSIEYSVFVQNEGWQATKTNGQIAGTEGLGKKLEALKINLVGDLSQKYDIYYRIHMSDIGWMGWTKNGDITGAIGFFTKIEAIQIKLVKKGTSIESSGSILLEKNYSVSYESHISEVGWQKKFLDGEMSGTTGKGLSIEAVKIDISANKPGDIMYQSYIHKKGWQDWTTNGNISGTTGAGRKIEALKIKLTGELASSYNIWYRVYVSNIGWMGWTCNGQKAGTDDINQGIEAYEILLLPIGLSAPGDTNNPYATGHWEGDHYYDAWGQMANDFKVIDGVKYFFNSLGNMIGKNVWKVIDVSKWQGEINWEAVKAEGEVDAVVVKIASSLSNPYDEQLKRNISELNRLGIPYGIYLYSYESGAEGGVRDAQRIISALNDPNIGIHLTLPIYYDLEVWDGGGENRWWYQDPVSTYRPLIEAFDKTMRDNGLGDYWKIYTNKNWAESALAEWSTRISWVARYNHFCGYTGPAFNMWQYTSSSERVSGISGGVDSNVYFL